MSLFNRLDKIKHRRTGVGGHKVQDKVQDKVQAKPPVSISGEEVITSATGECVFLQKVYQGHSLAFPERGTVSLHSNLKLLRGVGCVNEERLKAQGYHSIELLTGHPRWGEHARKVLSLIKDCRVKELRELGAGDWEILSLFNPEDVVFLDIESTGLWASQPLFLVGMMYFRRGVLVAEQYFARHYREEKAVLESVDRVLKGFKVVVTYNGKRFDLPYIIGRGVAHRLFHRYEHYHVDLLYHARKHLKHLLPDCRLVTLEEYLLDFRREGDIPGYLIPRTYHRFVQTGDAGLVEPVLKHNRLDLLSMARLFRLVDPLYSVSLKRARMHAAPAGDYRGY